MSKRRYFCGGSVLAVALASTAFGAAAQTPPSPNQPAAVSEVVVTGSYIAGTPETAALPVDVIGSRELEQRGSPSMVQFIKTIPSSGAVVGENNRFGGGNGTATVNLRNLNASIGSVTGTRTLVLFNGRRVEVSARSGYAVDINSFPTAAIGRVEVLKDGAAATYGSDAIAGVVNFITRKNLDGFEVSGQYQGIKGSDGDWEVNGAWGQVGDWGDVLFTLGYRRRSELPVQERDWALRTGPAGYLQNPLGGWAATGNPGAYLYSTTAPAGSPDTGFTTAPFTNSFEDIGCAANGGAPYVLGSGVVSPTTACNFQYTTFDNLVENENHYSVYGEVNFRVTDDVTFHGEAMWNRNQTPQQSWAMTGPNQYPAPIAASGGSLGGGVSPIPAAGTSEQSRFYIPASNPGLIAFTQQVAAANCTGPVLPYGVDAASCAAGLAAAQRAAGFAALYGVVASPTNWRPVGFAGNPYTGDRHSHYSYNTDTWRIVGGFQGKLPWAGINYDVSATYQEIDYKYNLQDTSVNRLQLGLRGYGSRAGASDQCTAAETNNFTTGAGNAALGCYYFNPFASAIQQSLSNVPANPYYVGSSSIPGYNDAAQNRADVVNWMEEEQYNNFTTRMFVADLVFNGKTPLKLWAEDPVSWAAGAQFRYDRFIQEPDALYSATATPCVDSPPFGDGVPPCPTTSNGPFLFNANLRPFDLDRQIAAVFTEWRIPVLDSLEVTLAARYEKYKDLGDTFNPKIAARWQATDWLAFRGSASTTYRAPLPTWASGSYFQRNLTNATGTYRATDLHGNADLQPETADTYSVGVIFDMGPFNATLDYWKFKFKDQITTEATTDILNLMFPLVGGVRSTARCANPAYDAVRARFTFTGTNSVADCQGGPANVLSFTQNYINGGAIDTDGLDFQANVRISDDVFGGSLQAGVDGSYLLSYKEAPYNIEGFAVGSTVERAGTYRPSLFIGYNRMRANGFVNWSRGPHNLRWQTRWVSSTVIASTETTALAIARLVGGSTKIPEYWQHDITYTVQLPWDTTATVAVQNVFDKDPPFAFATQYNYDPFSGNPLGRVWVVGLKKRF